MKTSTIEVHDMHKGHAGHGSTSSPMSSNMAKEMGHGSDMDLSGFHGPDLHLLTSEPT